MDKVVIKNGYYLDESLFGTTNKNELWNKLINALNENTSQFSSIDYNKVKGTIRISYNDENQFLKLVKNIDINNILLKNLIRTTLLKVSFNQQTKTLNIVKDDESNEILYSIACNDNISIKNSLFFDEESIQDYTSTFKKEDYDECPYVLAIVKFNMLKSINEEQINTSSANVVYLCYNTNTNKLEKETYSTTINSFIKLNINSLIDFYNTSLSLNGYSETIFDSNNGNAYAYAFSDFSISLTPFKLLNKSMDIISNLKMFTSLRKYDNYISLN